MTMKLSSSLNSGVDLYRFEILHLYLGVVLGVP